MCDLNHFDRTGDIRFRVDKKYESGKTLVMMHNKIVRLHHMKVVTPRWR